MATERPVTSKARGICKYYATPRGCFAGNKCKFLHGEQEKLTPYDKNKPCRFYAAGFCKRGAQCWFVHAQPVASGSKTPGEPEPEDQDENLCSICYDTPVTYGLLAGCSHIFCLDCIKNWRAPQQKSMDVVVSGVIKTCPMCREPSKFVTPSSVFYAEGSPRKKATIEQYKASMARVPCKFFSKSPPTSRFCPFGNDCFYQHKNADGTHYQFDKGVDHYIKRPSGYYDGDAEFNGPFGATILASLQAALSRFRTSIEGLPDIGELPEGALEARPITLPGDEPGTTNAVFVPVPQSIVTALREFTAAYNRLSQADRALNDNFVFPFRDGQASNPLRRALPPLQSSSEELVHEFPPATLGGTGSTAPPHDDPLDPYEILQRPLDAPETSLSESFSIAPIREELITLDYGSDDTTLVPEENSPTEPSVVEAEPPAATAPALDVATTEPDADGASSPPTTTPVSGPSAASLEHAPDAPAVVVHDSDPPFTTDGRGRVVWSSTTGPRRRRRTSTSIPGGASASGGVPAGPSAAREKPREGASSERGAVPDRSPERGPAGHQA